VVVIVVVVVIVISSPPQRSPTPPPPPPFHRDKMEISLSRKWRITEEEEKEEEEEEEEERIDPPFDVDIKNGRDESNFSTDPLFSEV
jgi:hypothetical protein